jgi:predicted secreted protein
MRTPTTLHSLETTLVLALALAVSLPAAPAAAEDEAAPKMNLSFPGDFVRRVENDQAVLVL